MTTAERPRRPGLSAAVPVRRTEVTAAKPELLSIAARLRDEEPVCARGVAMASKLLTDGAGALYNPGADSDLWHASRAALLALETTPLTR